MGLAVVTVASGGLPVTEVTAYGMPVTEAVNLRGIAVTKIAARGLPVTFVSESGQVIPPFTGATLNGTNTLVVMSNGNLTVTHNNTNTNAGVISTSAQTTGKFYFEYTQQTSISTSNQIGIMSSAWSGIFSSSEMTANATELDLGTSSIIYSNGASTGKNLGTNVLGDIICFAINLTSRLAFIRRNNGNWNADGTANPATGVGGVVIAPTLSFRPIVRFGGAVAPTDAITANFGASAFAFAVPSGFTAGWPA